jgi:hypothetical protein
VRLALRRVLTMTFPGAGDGGGETKFAGPRGAGRGRTDPGSGGSGPGTCVGPGAGPARPTTGRSREEDQRWAGSDPAEW